MHVNQFKLLTTRRFFPLLVTQFGGSLNDHILKNLLIVFAIQQITRETLLALATGAFLIPILLFSRHAGEFADTHEKSQYIQYIKLFELAATILVLLAVYLSSVWLLLVAAFALGCKVAYFLPFKHSIVPQLLTADELIGGNAFMNATSFLASLLAIGAYTLWGIYPLALIMVCVALVGWFSSRFTPQAAALATEKYFYDLFEQDKIILFCIVCIGWFWFVNYLYLSLVFDCCLHALHNRDMILIVVGTFVAGTAIGSLLANFILHSEIILKYLPISLLVMILASTDLYFASISQSQLQFFIGLFAMGMAGGVFIVPLYATLQHKSAAVFRARNIACSSILNVKLIILAFLILLIIRYNGISNMRALMFVPISGMFTLIYVAWRRV